jgi:hypothetical protein
MTKEMAKLPVIWTRLSRRLARTHDARTLYAVDAKGGGRSSAIIRRWVFMPSQHIRKRQSFTSGRSPPVGSTRYVRFR